MGTSGAPLIANLFLFCYERDFMMSLSDDKQADIIDAFNTSSRYLDGILNIDNIYFDSMVSQVYLSEPQLDTEAAFLDFHLSISSDIVSTKIYEIIHGQVMGISCKSNIFCVLCLFVYCYSHCGSL